MTEESKGVVTVGEPVEYGSVYGYPKRRFPVFKGDSAEAFAIGVIKEERLVGPNGKPVGFVYYHRNNLRKHGEPVYYASLKAAVTALGYKLSRASIKEAPELSDEYKVAFGMKKPPRAKKAIEEVGVAA